MSEEKIENPMNMLTGAPCTEDEMHQLKVTQLAIDIRPWTDGIEIYLRGENKNLSPFPHPNRKMFQAIGLRIVEVGDIVDEYKLQDRSAFSLPHIVAIELMTKLWQLGYRPATNVVSSAAELEAVGKHLEDMRKLVFEEWLGTDKYFHKGSK